MTRPENSQPVILTIRIDPADMAVLEFFASKAGIEPERLASGLLKEALHRSEEAHYRIVEWP